MNVNVYINGHTTRDDEETNCTDRPFMLHFYLIGYNGCPGLLTFLPKIEKGAQRTMTPYARTIISDFILTFFTKIQFSHDTWLKCLSFLGPYSPTIVMALSKIECNTTTDRLVAVWFSQSEVVLLSHASIKGL